MKFTKRFLATVLTIVLTLSLGLPLTASAQSEEPLAFWAPVYIMNFDQTGRQLDVSGGLAPYRFEIDQNSLGLSVNADTGRVYSDGTRKSAPLLRLFQFACFIERIVRHLLGVRICKELDSQFSARVQLFATHAPRGGVLDARSCGKYHRALHDLSRQNAP